VLVGERILDTGCSILDTGYSILDTWLSWSAVRLRRTPCPSATDGTELPDTVFGRKGLTRGLQPAEKILGLLNLCSCPQIAEQAQCLAVHLLGGAKIAFAQV